MGESGLVNFSKKNFFQNFFGGAWTCKFFQKKNSKNFLGEPGLVNFSKKYFSIIFEGEPGLVNSCSGSFKIMFAKFHRPIFLFLQWEPHFSTEKKHTDPYEKAFTGLFSAPEKGKSIYLLLTFYKTQKLNIQALKEHWSEFAPLGRAAPIYSYNTTIQIVKLSKDH